MKIVISANGYPDIAEETEITEEELERRLDSGELWLCTAGCNETGMNDDPPIYHAKGDYRS
jgi:hypothetical protein